MTKIERIKGYKNYFIIVFIGMLIGLFLYVFYFHGLTSEEAEILNLSEGADNTVALLNGDMIEQQVSLHYGFDYIKIAIDMCPESGALDVIVKDAVGSMVAHYYLMNTDLKDSGLKIPFIGKPNSLYTIEIHGIEMQNGEEIRFFTTPQYESYGILLHNGKELTNNLCMRVMKETILGKSIVFWLVVIVLNMLFLCVYYLIYEKKCKTEQVFLVTGLSLGIIYMLLFPPYTVEDEQLHFATSYQFSSVLLGEEPSDSDGNILFRETDAMCLPRLGTVSTYQYWLQFLQGNDLFVGKQEMVSVNGPQLAINGNIIVYFPCIFGMMVARFLGLGVVPLMLFAKFNNLVTYILLSYFGIKKMPFGKGFLALVASLPMALLEAGSLSYDSLTNGISFAFIGCALSVIFNNHELRKREIVMVGFMCFLLGFTKGGLYLLLAGLLLLVFHSVKDLFSKDKLWVWMIWICGIGGYIVSRMGNKMIFGQTSAISGLVTGAKISDNGITYISFSQCVLNPLYTLRILITNFIDEFVVGLGDMLGARMSWQGVQVPEILVLAVIFALSFMLFYDVKRDKVVVLNWNKKWWVMLIGIIVIICIEFVMLLDMGMMNGTIRGVQGRYFLPIAPLATILCADKMRVHDEGSMRTIYLLTYGIYILFLLFVTMIILRK